MAIAVMAAAVLVQACVAPGEALRSDPTVSGGLNRIIAGGSGTTFYVYLVDVTTRTCWLSGDDGTLASMPCCATRRVPAAAELISWETDRSCGIAPADR